MKSRLFLTLLTALALLAALTGHAGSASARVGCDPTFVSQSGKVLSVLPNGVDDTVNLQCAFDAAVAIGAGARVQLSAGIFYTAQVVVNGFDGTFTGAGADATVITNLPNLYVTPVDMYLNPPSADNPWASLIAFVGGNIAISDLAIKIIGDHPTMGWTIFGIDPPPTELATAIVILGDEVHAKIERVFVEGELMNNSLYGYNLINGIYFEGFMGEPPWAPISGSFEVYDSTFKHMASGSPVFNLINSTVTISRNRYEDTGFDAADTTELINTDLAFTHNQVDGALFGFWIYTNITESFGSNLLIQNNVFRSTYGVYFEGTFGAGNTCLLKANNVQNVTDIGVFLGSDVSGCTVVGGSNKTNVLDLGTGNVLVGVNNMGTGVGPTISDFLRRKHP
jgi:hypothetical protein